VKAAKAKVTAHTANGSIRFAGAPADGDTPSGRAPAA
jgi:hypothetical protein